MAETLNISNFSSFSLTANKEKTSLVLIHGWGLNSGVWQPLIESFSDDFKDFFNIITIDLPGFGTNVTNEISPYTLENICKRIVEVIDEPAIYLGWSLGGLVATELALSYPKKALGLITVANSPKFLEENLDNDIWPGIKPKVLEGFHQQLHVDTKKTINGFLKIQAMGSPHIRHDIKQLSELVFQHELASEDTLDSSLKLLEISDYRKKLKLITQPFLRIYGNADSLVPKAVIEKIDRLSPNSDSHTFMQASHAPFISHPEDFKLLLTNWLLNKSQNNFINTQ